MLTADMRFDFSRGLPRALAWIAPDQASAAAHGRREPDHLQPIADIVRVLPDGTTWAKL